MLAYQKTSWKFYVDLKVTSQQFGVDAWCCHAQILNKQDVPRLFEKLFETM